MTDKTSLSYKDAGVDIDAGNALVSRIKHVVKETRRPEVMGGLGGFGALCAVPQKYKEPVLVSGTDGVGTKLRLAMDLARHDTIGIDLVAMCVNDLVVAGAEPLFFLDYYATGKLDVDTAARVVTGIAEGCKQAGCALVGGETAEMPGMYPEGEYDLAGFAVGAVEKSKIINGSTIAAGDVVIALASSGPHSNGYSLIRKIIERAGIKPTDSFGDSTFGDAIMAPTRLYVKPVLAAIQQHGAAIKGLVHVTGGGLLENIPRIVPAGLAAHLQKGEWQLPPLFQWLQEQGNVDTQEMYRVFNCGLGMVIVVEADAAEAIKTQLSEAGETVYHLGEIVEQGDGAQVVVKE